MAITDIRTASSTALDAGAVKVLRNTYALLAMTLLFGWLIAYVASVQQIFADVFHRPELMPAMFALCASGMGVASWLNARLVERLGMRVIGHGALLAFIAITALHWVLARVGYETMASFVIFQGVSLACLGMCSGNFGTIAMEPLAAIAGIGANGQRSRLEPPGDSFGLRLARPVAVHAHGAVGGDVDFGHAHRHGFGRPGARREHTRHDSQSEGQDEDTIRQEGSAHGHGRISFCGRKSQAKVTGRDAQRYHASPQRVHDTAAVCPEQARS